MLIQITLSDSEIRRAIAKAVREKMPEIQFYDNDLVIDGSVRFKKRRVRKENIMRMVATVKSSKGI